MLLLQANEESDNSNKARSQFNQEIYLESLERRSFPAPTAQDLSCVLNECPLDLFTSPEFDGQDSQILSLKRPTGPYSFMNAKVLEDNRVGEAPTPTYLAYSSIKPAYSGRKDDILVGL